MQHQAFYTAVFDSVLEVIVWHVQVLITPHAKNTCNFKEFFYYSNGELWKIVVYIPACVWDTDRLK